jgi:deazaflavin-dependent oxidoreductase (nitroreductase family)
MAERYAALIRSLGHRKWFTSAGRRLVPVDRWLQQRTRGRVTILGTEALPSLLLTTTGRKSGRPRSVPLLYATQDGAYVVTASNWGQDHHPAWSENLIARPEATVEIRGTSVPVTATLAFADERDALWTVVKSVWPAYETYSARSGREIRLFLLRPTRG